MASQSSPPAADPTAADSFHTAPPEMMLSHAADGAPQCFVTDTERTVCPTRGKALPFSDDMQEDANARVASEGVPLMPTCSPGTHGIQCAAPLQPAQPPASTVAEDTP